MNYLKIMEAFVEEAYDAAVAAYRKMPNADAWNQLSADMLVFQCFRDAMRSPEQKSKLMETAQRTPVTSWAAAIVETNYGRAVDLEDLVERMGKFAFEQVYPNKS